MREQPQVVDERLALRACALEVEREHGACAFREVFFCEFMVAMLRQFRMMNRADECVRAQELKHFARVRDVPLHAHGQRFDALQYLPRAHRRHARTKVPEPFAAATQQECRRRRLLSEHHIVEAVIRRRQRGELLASHVGHPIESPAVHEQPTDHHAVAL